MNKDVKSGTGSTRKPESGTGRDTGSIKKPDPPAYIYKTHALNIEWGTISIRSIKIVVLLILALAGFLGYRYIYKTSPLSIESNIPIPAIKPAARFMDFSGNVDLKQKDKFAWIPASFKIDLFNGDRVRTIADSTAKIRFDDGTEITVQPDSIIEIKTRTTHSKVGGSIVQIEQGTGAVDTSRSGSDSTIKTKKLNVQLKPGGHGDVTTQEQGNDQVRMKDGDGTVTLPSGEKISLTKLEQLTVDQKFKAVKEKLPPVPVPYAPPNGSILEFLTDEGLSTDLKWRDVSEAVKYHVQVSETPYFDKLKGEDPALKMSFLKISIPKSFKKQYFWRVRSIDENNMKSPWSEVYQFVVKPDEVNVLNSRDPKPGPPVLKITDMNLFLPYVRVQGITEADAFLTLNDYVIDVRQDGSFVHTHTLTKAGLNTLNFVAEDTAGNKTKVQKKVPGY